MKLYKKLLIATIIFNNNILIASDLNTAQENSGDISTKSNDIINQIQGNLGNYYSQDDNKEPEETIEATDWMIISPPKNCSSWVNIGNDQEERTCEVIEAKIDKTQSTLDVNILNNLDIKWEERISEIKFTRGITNTTSNPPDTENPIPEYISEVEAYLNIPITAGLNENFNISWDSFNATYCSVTQQGNVEAAGTGIVRFGTLGINTITATCSDGISSATISKNIEIVTIPIEISITAPSTALIGRSFSYSWNSKGASACSLDSSTNYLESLISGAHSKTPTTRDDILLKINCTNGTDFLTETKVVPVVVAPPVDGQCYYGGSIDDILGIKFTKYSVTDYNSLSGYTTSGIANSLKHGTFDMYVTDNMNPIIYDTTSDGKRFGSLPQYGWRTPNNTSGYACRTSGTGSNRTTYYYYYANGYACDNGKLYIVQADRVCPGDPYKDRRWKGKVLVFDFNTVQ